jgi:hypothetical protein
MSWTILRPVFLTTAVTCCLGCGDQLGGPGEIERGARALVFEGHAISPIHVSQLDEKKERDADLSTYAIGVTSSFENPKKEIVQGCVTIYMQEKKVDDSFEGNADVVWQDCRDLTNFTGFTWYPEIICEYDFYGDFDWNSERRIAATSELWDNQGRHSFLQSPWTDYKFRFNTCRDKSEQP